MSLYSDVSHVQLTIRRDGRALNLMAVIHTRVWAPMKESGKTDISVGAAGAAGPLGVIVGIREHAAGHLEELQPQRAQHGFTAWLFIS